MRQAKDKKYTKAEINQALLSTTVDPGDLLKVISRYETTGLILGAIAIAIEKQRRDSNEDEYSTHKVLNDGHVRLVDCMGDDAAIVQAARVSYGAGTKTPSDDRTLIRYLMRHRHTTPFEMASLKFHVRVPMDCWRQWIRHRTASVNEYSTRYSEAIDSYQHTSPGEWRAQSGSNKQGSEGSISEIDQEILTSQEAGFCAQARRVYQDRLKAGVAREQARKDLPLSTYTEAYWKIDLHNLFHFLSLRMDSHAQAEIRAYATIIGEQIVAPLFPLAWEAFCDYRLGGMFLSRLDIEMIRNMVTNMDNDWPQIPWHSTYSEMDQVQPKQWQGQKRCRERDECLEKLKELGVIEDD